MQALDVRRSEVISLIGGGGKTTLMFALAGELAATGEAVITTTTTRIFKPSASETFLILEPDEEKLIARMLSELKNYRHISLAAEDLPSGKIGGIRPEIVNRLAKLEPLSYVIVEADGARRKSLKAPNATEPVIPDSTSLVVPVVGIDALGCQLTKENVFRPEIVSWITGLPLGSIISAETIATLVTHTEGIIKGSPGHARIIPLLNKVDLEGGLSKARDLAARILERKHSQIQKVLLAQVQCREPVVEVVSAG